MKVFLDHDGGVDDFIAQLILSVNNEVDLIGISVIDADCLVDVAIDVSRRLLSLVNRDDIPIACSTLKGVNPFPMEWRQHCKACADMPVLNIPRIEDAQKKARISNVTGQQLLVDCVRESPEPVTIIVTGPMTNLAWALDNDPTFFTNVKQVVVMGGAVDVPGNVNEPNHDGSAEWNVYWDPASFQRCLQSPLSIVIFALDATNTVPISREFMRRFGAQNDFLASQFVGNSYAMCSFEYYAWDVLTAVYVLQPDICQLEEVYLSVVLSGEQQGRTQRDPNGSRAFLAKNVDQERFYEYVLSRMKSVTL